MATPVVMKDCCKAFAQKLMRTFFPDADIIKALSETYNMYYVEIVYAIKEDEFTFTMTKKVVGVQKCGVCHPADHWKMLNQS
jgi:hypothetical protein